MTNIQKMSFRLLGAQWFGVAFVGVISFFVSILIARVLGPVEYGSYVKAISFAYIISILIDGGFAKVVQREHAFQSLHLSISPSKFLQLAYGHIFIVLIVGAGLSFIISPNHYAVLVSALLFFGALALNQIILASLRGQGRMMREAFWQVFGRSLTAILIVLAVFLGANLSWHMFAVQFLGALVFALILSKRLLVKPSFHLNWSVYKVLLPFIWLDLASMIFFRADMVICGFLNIPNSDVGQYGVASKLIEGVMLISAPVGVMLFRNFRLNIFSPSIILRQLVPSLILAFLVALVFACAFYIGANDIIRLAYGSEFKKSIELLELLCWVLVFIIPNGILLQTALAIGKERSLALLATMLAFLNISGNLLLISSQGVMAAVWMTLLTEFLLTTGLMLIVFKHLNLNREKK